MLLTPIHTEGQETSAAKQALVYTAFTVIHIFLRMTDCDMIEMRGMVSNILQSEMMRDSVSPVRFQRRELSLSLFLFVW